MTISNKWILTYSGLRIELDEPERNVERFTIRDVAHALSLTCRFNGHCSDFYSVAEHCLHVERYATLNRKERLIYQNPQYLLELTASEQLTALMHDAPEYILGDMTSPQKSLDKDYRAMEEAFSPLIAARWNTDWPLPQFVKEADRVIYQRERRDLFETTGYPNEWAPLVPDILPEEEWPFKHSIYVRPLCWTPRLAEMRFLARFKELAIARDNEVV